MESPDAVRGEGNKVHWYRTPLERETLQQLNARSDAQGWRQTLGHLGLIVGAGAAAFYAASQGWYWAALALVFVYGTFASFAINAVHEMVHRSVFKTQLLNEIFVRVFSFPGWINFEHFHTSHVRHHQYTLHPPDDLEVVLPIRLMVKHFFKGSFINPIAIKYVLKNTLRLARGQFEGEWEMALFPPGEPEKRRATIRWARTLLIGHGLVLVVSLCLKLWLLPVLVSMAPCYGGWLFFLCNNTQHVGLQDNVSDFRLCCRTFTVNPLVEFLYWHMNFHTEHHMYAAVPCYNLAKLHAAIKHDLPPCPHGLLATWRAIASIQMTQEKDPAYQYAAPLPQKR